MTDMPPVEPPAVAQGAPRRLEGFLERTYETFGGRLYHYLLGLLRSAADAEDAVQTVFVKLAQRKGADIDDLTGYLFAAARNEALRLLDRRRRAQLPEPAEPPAMFDAPPGGEEETARLERALGSLPADQREVVMLKIWEGLKFREIAAVLGVPQDTAASRYRYAMEKLKEALESAP